MAQLSLSIYEMQKGLKTCEVRYKIHKSQYGCKTALQIFLYTGRVDKKYGYHKVPMPRALFNRITPAPILSDGIAGKPELYLIPNPGNKFHCLDFFKAEFAREYM